MTIAGIILEVVRTTLTEWDRDYVFNTIGDTHLVVFHPTAMTTDEEAMVIGGNSDLIARFYIRDDGEVGLVLIRGNIRGNNRGSSIYDPTFSIEQICEIIHTHTLQDAKRIYEHC